MEKILALLADAVKANPKTNFALILALCVTVTMQHFDIKELRGQLDVIRTDSASLHSEVASCQAGNSKVEVLVDRQEKMSQDLARLIDLAFRKLP